MFQIIKVKMWVKKKRLDQIQVSSGDIYYLHKKRVAEIDGTKMKCYKRMEKGVTKGMKEVFFFDAKLEKSACLMSKCIVYSDEHKHWVIKFQQLLAQCHKNDVF